MNRRIRKTRRPAPRGLSMLEAILATVLLTIVAGVILNVIAAGNRTQINAKVNAAGYEVANRLLLQWLDDRVQVIDMDRTGAPIDYGDYRFRWEVDVRRTPVMLSVVPGGRAQSLDGTRIEEVTARVWLVDDTDRLARRVVSPIPVAEITRLSNPTHPRNPDAITRLTGDFEQVMRWFESQEVATLSGGAGSGDPE